jgi:hypothetical protein
MPDLEYQMEYQISSKTYVFHYSLYSRSQLRSFKTSLDFRPVMCGNSLVAIFPLRTPSSREKGGRSGGVLCKQSRDDLICRRTVKPVHEATAATDEQILAFMKVFKARLNELFPSEVQQLDQQAEQNPRKRPG